MKYRILVFSSLATLLSTQFYMTTAEAQGRHDRQRQEREQRQQERAQSSEEEDAYPNATREDPEIETSQRNMRKIQAAFDDLNDGEYEKAAETLGELDGNSRLSPYEQALVDQGLAQAAYEDDDIDEAIQRWQKAVDSNALLNKDHFRLMYQIAQLQLSEEQYDQALATMQRWQTESGENRAEAIALKGNALYRLERYDEAIAALDQAIAAAGANPDPALFELKMASYYEKEDYAGAAETLEQLVRHHPNDVKYQINLAQMYIELEQNDRALGILQQAKASGNLQEPEHWRQYYQLLSYADKPAEAAAAIKEGIEAGALKADKETLRSLGDNYYLAEQLDQAIEAYGKSADLSPDDGNTDQQRGHLLVERERYAEARDALKKAFEKGNLKDEGTAYLLLGECEQELGNIAAARAAFQKATAFERSRSNAEAWLKNL